MKKIYLLFSLLFVLTCITNAQTTINFDDLQGSQQQIPQGYAGFTWLPYAWYLDAINYGSGNGYYNGVTSIPNVAFTAYANYPIGFKLDNPSDGTFLLNSMQVTGAWGDVTIYFIGKNDGSLLYTSENFTVNSYAPTLIELNWKGIDEVEIYRVGNGSHLVIDDIVINDFRCPEDIIVNNDPGECGATVNFELPEEGMISEPASGSWFPGGTTVVSVGFQGEGGMDKVCTFNVTVKDVEPPVISVCPGVKTYIVQLQKVTYLKKTVWRGKLPQEEIKKNMTYTDNCDPVDKLTLKFSQTEFMPNDWGTNTETVTVVDASGNVSLPCTIKVIVRYPLKSGEVDIYTEMDGEEIQPLSVDVYPNPTKGKLTLDIWNLNNPVVKAVVYNLSGQVVFQDQFRTEGQINIDLTGKISGVYLLKVFADDKEFTHKIILED